MGAGKSSVIAILQELHLTVLDCDKINADLLRKGQEGYRALVAVFGDKILDEDANIDTKKMSTYIFAHKEHKQQAEDRLHPLIKEEILRQVTYHEEEELVIVEVPLLFEVKWESFFDEVWVVTCEEDLLLERLAMHRGIERAEAMLRLSHQMPQAEKVKKADVVLYNNSDKESLKQQIYDILRAYRE